MNVALGEELRTGFHLHVALRVLLYVLQGVQDSQGDKDCPHELSIIYRLCLK